MAGLSTIPAAGMVQKKGAGGFAIWKEWFGLDALDTLLNRFLDMGIPAFDCLIYHKGKKAYRRLAGFADYERTRTLDTKQLFRIYSVTKLITVTAVMQMIEAGTLRLEDRLSDFFPEFAQMQVKAGDSVRNADTPITMEHLLTMTAGFSYDRSPDRPAWCAARAASDGHCPTVQTVRFLAHEPLEYEPGTGWQYSFGHDILAAVVETISGERFGAYVKKRIFTPLGMTQSTFDDGQILEGALCAQYRYHSDTHAMMNCGLEVQNGFRLGDAYESGGAGCCSTAEDVMKLLEALRKGEILRPETVTLLSTNHLRGVQTEIFQKDQADTRYGYGLGVGCPNGTAGWNMFGWGGAAGAYCAVDRENELSIVYLQHVMNAPNKYLRRELYPAAMRELDLIERKIKFSAIVG